MTFSMEHKKNTIDWALHTARESAWAPLSVFGGYLIGLLLGAYRAFPSLDIPTHFLGGVAITYFFRSALANSQKLLGPLSHSARVLFAFTCTGTMVVIWEFFEFAADALFGTHMVRGLHDTLLDMCLGLSGALLLTLLYRKR